MTDDRNEKIKAAADELLGKPGSRFSDPRGSSTLDNFAEEFTTRGEQLDRLVSKYLAECEAAGVEPLDDGWGRRPGPSARSVIATLSRRPGDGEDLGVERRSLFFIAYPALETGADEYSDMETVHMYADWHRMNHERLVLEADERLHAKSVARVEAEGQRLRVERARLEAEGKVKPRTDD